MSAIIVKQNKRSNKMEVISLTKGGRIDLSKAAPSTLKFAFGLGWDPQKFDSVDFDLDGSAFAMKGGKVNSGAEFLFYGTPGLSILGGAVTHSGDNLTGAGAGDDETITVDTSKIDTNAVEEIQFNVTIYDAETRKQTFGQVDNAYIRVYDPATKVEIARYDLTEDYFGETAVVFGKLYYKDGSWRFQAVGSGYKGGLKALASAVGLNIA